MYVVKGFVTSDYTIEAWQAGSDFLHIGEAKNLVAAHPQNWVPQQSTYSTEGLEESRELLVFSSHWKLASGASPEW